MKDAVDKLKHSLEELNQAWLDKGTVESSLIYVKLENDRLIKDLQVVIGDWWKAFVMRRGRSWIKYLLGVSKIQI